MIYYYCSTLLLIITYCCVLIPARIRISVLSSSRRCDVMSMHRKCDLKKCENKLCFHGSYKPKCQCCSKCYKGVEELCSKESDDMRCTPELRCLYFNTTKQSTCQKVKQESLRRKRQEGFQHAFNEKSCSWNTEKANKRLKEYISKDYQDVMSMAACQKKCEDEAECLAVTRRNSNNECFLAYTTRNAAGDNYKTVTGFTYNDFICAGAGRPFQREGSEETCRWNAVKERQKMKHTGNAIGTVNGETLTECRKGCEDDSRCKSIAYRFSDDKCKMYKHNATSNPTTVKNDQTHWVYYDITCKVEVETTTKHQIDVSEIVSNTDQCPTIPEGTMGSCVEECSSDNDCTTAGERCCGNGCGHECTSVVTAPCPEVPEGTMGTCNEDCTSDVQCAIPGERCCSNGCGHSCQSTATTTTTTTTTTNTPVVLVDDVC